MQYYRCRCGDSQAWTTMGVATCSGCSKCGTNLAQFASGHAPPAPHEFVTKYEHDTGAPYEVCNLCMRRRSEVEAPSGPEAA